MVQSIGLAIDGEIQRNMSKVGPRCVALTGTSDIVQVVVWTRREAYEEHWRVSGGFEAADSRRVTAVGCAAQTEAFKQTHVLEVGRRAAAEDAAGDEHDESAEEGNERQMSSRNLLECERRRLVHE